MNMIRYAGLLLMPLVIIGCGASGPKTGYYLVLSDGWTKTTLHCEEYSRKGNHIVCLDAAGGVSHEAWISDDMRVMASRANKGI